MKRFIILFFGLFSILVFSGCSTGTIQNEPVRGLNASSFGEVSPSPRTSELGRFGQSVVFDDGLVVYISEPEVFTASDRLASGDLESVKFVVRVTNGTGKNYDPTLFYATVQSGNEEAEPIFDSKNDLGIGANTVLLPDREAEWKIAFSVKNPDDMIMEFIPDLFEHEPTVFATSNVVL